MKSKSYSPIEELRNLDPVGGEGGNEAPPELLAAILAADPLEPRAEQRSPRPERRRQPRRRLALAGAAFVAAAGLALTIGLPGGGEERGAAAALSQVAEAAAAQPAAADLPYRYLKTRSVYIGTIAANGEAWSVYEPEVSEAWAADDGSGRVRRFVEAPRFVGPGDREAWEAADKIDFLPHGFRGHSADERVPAGTLEAVADVSSLPTDPEALAARLDREARKIGGSAPVAAKTMELIAEDLGDPAASPELRKALYEAATTVPGIRYLGAATDFAGRSGVAVGVVSDYTGGKTLYSLIYDPESSAVLASEQTFLKKVTFADGTRPLLRSATVYLDSGPVENLTATP